MGNNGRDGILRRAHKIKHRRGTNLARVRHLQQGEDVVPIVAQVVAIHELVPDLSHACQHPHITAIPRLGGKLKEQDKEEWKEQGKE